MANVTVSVNGKPVEQYIGEERGKEIAEFVAFEFRQVSRWGRQPIISAKPIRNNSGVRTGKVERVLA